MSLEIIGLVVEWFYDAMKLRFDTRCNKYKDGDDMCVVWKRTISLTTLWNEYSNERARNKGTQNATYSSVSIALSTIQRSQYVP